MAAIPCDVGIEQAQCEAVVLDRIFNVWLSEAILISGLLPIQVRTMKALPHTWHWDGHEHVDPAKEALAQQTRLASGTTTYADEFAKVGKDHVKAFESQAAALGLTVDEYRQKLVEKLFGTGAPAVLGWATGNLPEPPNSPQVGMLNMRTVMPALQRAKPVKVVDDGLVFARVALPKQRRETIIVRDLPVDDIAREIVEWITKD